VFVVVAVFTCLPRLLTTACLPAAANVLLLLQFNVTGVTLDQALQQQQQQQQQQQRVALLKVDVEGFEPQVLAGAAQLLQKQRIDNILLEYSPHVVERTE
jgi:FkbM family methyltransferase